VGTPINLQIPTLAAVPPPLAPTLAGSSTGPSLGPLKGEPLRLWEPLSTPKVQLWQQHPQPRHHIWLVPPLGTTQGPLCLAWRETTPQGSRCPGPRCSTAVLAALALGKTAPPAQARSPPAGPLPSGLNLVQLLGTRIPTLRRFPIAASSTCARAMSCLLQALERDQT